MRRVEQEPELLRVLEVTKRFGGVTALKSVSLNVPPSSIVGLIGPNGAGKSTLLNVISGMLPADGGQVLLGSDDVLGLSPEALAHIGIGRTFQKPRLFPSLNGAEHLIVGAWGKVSGTMGIRDLSHRRIRSSDVSEGVRFAIDWAREAGIHDVLDQEVRALSFGQRRMLEVLRALAGRPRLLLLDEPASGLAGHERHKFAELLDGLNRDENLAVLVVEHDIDFVEMVAKNVFVLSGEGRLLAEGPMADLKRDQSVLDAYLGSEAPVS